MLKKGFTSFENHTYGKDDNKFSPSGMRVKRGLYKTKGMLVNADVNRSLNILRK